MVHEIMKHYVFMLKGMSCDIYIYMINLGSLHQAGALFQ